jgi:hypothetical protein
MRQIKEIIKRIEQGATEPVLCRAEDDTLWVVKTALSGRDSMIKEWVCFRLAQGLGVSIPECDFVFMDSSGAKYSPFPEAREMVRMPAFASRLIVPSDLLSVASVDRVDLGVRKLVLLFDWWLLNCDRTDDNINLLWIEGSPLRIIDHNLAFDQTDATSFWEQHVFRRDRIEMAKLRVDAMPKLERCMGGLRQFWAELPPEWTEVCNTSSEVVDNILKRCRLDGFWSQQ